MATEKSSAALIAVISNLFHNFHKLLLTNVLFAIPFALFFALFWLINTVSGLNANYILCLTAIPLFPYYAGVVQVTAHIALGRENVSVLQDFVAAIKDNFLRFLVHGVVFYLSLTFSYYSLVAYASWAQKQGEFYILFAITILVAVIMMFAFFYIPSMTVTFDISMKNIYKNSLLMSFGEIKHNLAATFGLFILFVIASTILFCCTTQVAVIIATVILFLFLMPSVASFIINSAVYKPMYNMIVENDKKIDTIDKKIENRRNGKMTDTNSDTAKGKYDEILNDIDIDEISDSDEYIYYNGKMVKKSVILKLKKDAEEKENNNGRTS